MLGLEWEEVHFIGSLKNWNENKNAVEFLGKGGHVQKQELDEKS